MCKPFFLILQILSISRKKIPLSILGYGPVNYCFSSLHITFPYLINTPLKLPLTSLSKLIKNLKPQYLAFKYLF